MEGTPVRVLVPEDSHIPRGNYAHKPQLLKLTHPRIPAAQQEGLRQREARVLQVESSPHLLQLEQVLTRQLQARSADIYKQN